MTTYTIRKGDPAKTRTDLVVIAVAQSSGKSGALEACPGGESVAAAYGRKWQSTLGSMGFTGAAGETLRLPSGDRIRAGQLLLVGVGARDALSLKDVRRAAGVAARSVGNAASVTLALPASDADHVRAVTEGFLSGGYAFKKFRSGSTESPLADVIVLSDAARRQDVVEAFEQAQVLNANLTRARDWVNTPSNALVPEVFADEVVKSVKGVAGLTAETLDEAALAELGCGGILGVGQGSANRPCLVKLTWRPKGARGDVALVGKGITYDSGGLTIKPGGSMSTMKFDMGGAAAVAAAVRTIAELKIPVNVTAWLPMAENMISGEAMRPGDVLTMYDGQTVEVTNTDAEGRLILADALAMAAETEPDAIVEISTLTGPCVVALGDKIAGLFGDDGPVADVTSAAQTAGELVWRLPIPEHSLVSVTTESKIADVLQHNWVRYGSSSFAAAFLKQFTADVPFAHLDIAGPAWNDKAPWGQVPSGATGFGIPTLVEYVAAVSRS